MSNRSFALARTRFVFRFPYAVGVEGSGTVVAVASDVDIQPGTRVCWTAVLGSCATFVVAPAHLLAVLPDSLGFEAGASLAHAGLTAAGLVRHCPLTRGATAVVWGAAGAVGRMLVAMLADRGVSVIGIAGGERIEAARRAGADYVIDRRREDVAERVRRLCGGGVAVIFDPVGAETYRVNLTLLGPRGYLINYGQLSGALPAVDLMDLMDAGSIFVSKYGPRAGLASPRTIGPWIAEALALAATKPLASDVAGRFPLDRVRDAYAMLDAMPAGKVLVLPSD